MWKQNMPQFWRFSEGWPGFYACPSCVWLTCVMSDILRCLLHYELKQRDCWGVIRICSWEVLKKRRDADLHTEERNEKAQTHTHTYTHTHRHTCTEARILWRARVRRNKQEAGRKWAGQRRTDKCKRLCHMNAYRSVNLSLYIVPHCV